jgi:hypothetical protein
VRHQIRYTSCPFLDGMRLLGVIEAIIQFGI